jgi:hypothetical protein
VYTFPFSVFTKPKFVFEFHTLQSFNSGKTSSEFATLNLKPSLDWFLIKLMLFKLSLFTLLTRNRYLDFFFNWAPKACRRLGQVICIRFEQLGGISDTNKDHEFWTLLNWTAHKHSSKYFSSYFLKLALIQLNVLFSWLRIALSLFSWAQLLSRCRLLIVSTLIFVFGHLWH